MADDTVSQGSRRDKAVERLTNLCFALHGAASNGGSPDRSAAWIRSHVAGYQDLGDEAFQKQLSRDIRSLQRAGVPVTQSASKASAGPGQDRSLSVYRMQQADYQLAEVEFTPEEAMVLGVAAGMGQPGGLSSFSSSAWTKIAASGASRDLSGAPVYTADNDLTRLEPNIVRDILTTVRKGLRINFTYVPGPQQSAQSRSMDPWGLVTLHNRVYLVGWDNDRGAPRAFRLLRVAEIRATRQAPEHAHPTQSLQEVVEASLYRDVVGRAVLRIPAGRAGELAALGTPGVDGTVVVENVSRDFLVRTGAGYAADVEVLEPTSVRDDIAALLRAAAATASQDKQDQDKEARD